MTNNVDKQYLRVLRNLLNNGIHRPDRTGTGTYALFGEQMRFDLSEGFPLLTTKKLHFKSIKVELLWFLKGLTNTDYLHKYGVTIWDEWADSDGNLGPVYGSQWRSWPIYPQQTYLGDGNIEVTDTIDQIKNVISSLDKNPFSRRHIVTAWNPAEVDNMALPPCHCLFQFWIADGKLSCHLYQRSADWFLGVPFNIASYALLTHLIARELGIGVGEFIHSFGDLHLYANHREQAAEQLLREPMEKLPTLSVDPNKISIFNLDPEDINIEGYEAHPNIKAEISK